MLPSCPALPCPALPPHPPPSPAGTPPTRCSSLTASCPRCWCQRQTGRRGPPACSCSERSRRTSTPPGGWPGGWAAGQLGGWVGTWKGLLVDHNKVQHHAVLNTACLNRCCFPALPCPALPRCRLEHVGAALAAAQKAAAKDVSASAISLLESPPADLWPRLNKVCVVGRGEGREGRRGTGSFQLAGMHTWEQCGMVLAVRWTALIWPSCLPPAGGGQGGCQGLRSA